MGVLGGDQSCVSEQNLSKLRPEGKRKEIGEKEEVKQKCTPGHMKDTYSPGLALSMASASDIEERAKPGSGIDGFFSRLSL